MPVRAPPLPARYRDLQLIARGGMARIYRASDAELGREVAVKVLADVEADDDLRARFMREAVAAARLSGGPHIVATYDVGQLDGQPFLVMEYLAGGSLADRLRSGGISQAQALAWLDQAARALDFAHAHGVVHRDVKPGNLLLDEGGNVHVADFGIARADGLDSHTQTGVVLGTAGYLAPEQARGGHATDASDRYALAVVAHELLTGVRPGATPAAAPPRRAKTVFLRALAQAPHDRFDSCREFVAELRAALEGPEEPPTLALRPRRTRRPRRGRPPVAIVLALPLGLVGAGLAIGLSARGGDTHRARPGSSPVIVRTVTAPAAAPVQPAAAVTPGRASQGRGKKQKKDHGPRRGRGHGRGEKGKD